MPVMALELKTGVCRMLESWVHPVLKVLCATVVQVWKKNNAVLLVLKLEAVVPVEACPIGKRNG